MVGVSPSFSFSSSSRAGFLLFMRAAVCLNGLCDQHHHFGVGRCVEGEYYRGGWGYVNGNGFIVPLLRGDRLVSAH